MTNDEPGSIVVSVAALGVFILGALAGRRAFADLLAVFQFARDGLEAARNHLLPFA